MIEVKLPTFHRGQVRIWRERSRLNVVRCGRRWGKTKMEVVIAGDAVAKGKFAGIFTPEYKQLLEPFDELRDILRPMGGRSNKTDGMIRPRGGGKLDVWTLNDNELAGRGREYHKVLIDEAAFTKRSMMGIWDKSINPTLLTTGGDVWVFSTPNGLDEENFFYQLCNDKSLGFKEHYAPTSDNPMIIPAFLEKERERNHPLVFQQEFLAQFVDWTGVQFFELEKMLIAGQPVANPERCDTVFAIVDTAIKTGKEHDGTAVIFFSFDRRNPSHPLTILDYDKKQIEGAMLETWLPDVFARLEELRVQCGARLPSLGAFIEDKGSGTVLLQQAAKRPDWPAQPVDSKLTALGKDERAISVSGYVFQGKIKLSVFAYNKLITYKGVTRNHLLSEVLSFRIGDKDPHRADDLTDCFTYGISLTLGNSSGY